MSRNAEIHSHENVIRIMKKSFDDEIRAMQQSVWYVLKSKDEEIDMLTREKNLDGEEKSKLMSRITELEDHVAILSEQLMSKDEALMNQQSNKERVGKPQILWEDNERLRSELNTLKHIKMKEDQDYKDRIETLTKLKDHKERDLETLKHAQTNYYASFKDKLDWFTAALQERDEIIRTLRIKENETSGETESYELSSSVKENKKLNVLFYGTTKEANDSSDFSEDKSFDTATSSSKIYEDMELEEELPKNDQINHTDFGIPERCPMPGCHSEVKFANKSLGNLKGHLSRHFSKQIIKSFPFKPQQACPLCLEKNKRHLLVHKTGHIYHLGIVHRQIQLYVTEDERHILKFLK